MIGVTAIWSLIPTASELALRGVSPSLLAFCRLSIGLGFLILIFFVQGGKVKNLIINKKVFLAGIALSGNYIFFSSSLWFTTAISGYLIAQVQFVALAILAAIFLKEKLTLKRIIGIFCVVSGISFILFTTSEQEQLMAIDMGFGSLLMLIAGLCFAIFGVTARALSHHNTLPFLIPTLIIAVIIAGVTMSILPSEQREPLIYYPTLTTPIIVGSLGLIGTGLALLLTVAALKYIDTATAGVITTFAVITNLIVARTLLNEPITPVIIFSTLIVFTGIIMITQTNTGTLKANKRNETN